MPELIPISEQCVVALGELLRGITADDGEYANDVIVERFRPSGNPHGVEDATLQIVLVDEIPADDTDNTPTHLNGYRMQVKVWFYPLNAAGSGTQDEQAIGRLIACAHADVRKRLETDRTLGNLAIIAAVAPPPPPAQQGELPANCLPLDVIFWTKRGNPYQLWSS